MEPRETFGGRNYKNAGCLDAGVESVNQPQSIKHPYSSKETSPKQNPKRSLNKLQFEGLSHRRLPDRKPARPRGVLYKSKLPSGTADSVLEKTSKTWRSSLKPKRDDGLGVREVQQDLEECCKATVPT